MCRFSDRENNSKLQKCLQEKAKLSKALLHFTIEVDQNNGFTEKKRIGKSEFIINDLSASIGRLLRLQEDKLEYLLDFSTAVQ